jgi:dihydropteroate synthase
MSPTVNESAGFGDAPQRVQARKLQWKFGQHDLVTGDFPLIMGIVNVTPDSFSDGGQFIDADRAVEHALSLAKDGADILDIGGESTRPGSETITVTEELNRVVAVIEGLRDQTDALLSIDTTKAEVARQALAAGADIVNDISGLTFDAEMVDVCAKSDCGVICMHIRGTPQTMQADPHYDDVVAEVSSFLADRIGTLVDAGIAKHRIVIDPGIGFGKTAQHNVDLLSNVATLRDLGCPVLIGHSRKRFLAKVLGRPVEERVFGTVGVAIAVAAQNADLIRVHDVAATNDALLAWHTIQGGNEVPEESA